MDTGTYVCFAVDYSAEVSVYLRVEQGMVFLWLILKTARLGTMRLLQILLIIYLGAVQKKLTFLADMSAKGGALRPLRKCKFFLGKNKYA